MGTTKDTWHITQVVGSWSCPYMMKYLSGKECHHGHGGDKCEWETCPIKQKGSLVRGDGGKE